MSDYFEMAASLPKTAHEFLTDQGAYTHVYIEPDYDDGDAENGPGFGGHDEFDLYTGDSHNLILQRGLLVDMLVIDWNAERFFAEMPNSPFGDDYNNYWNGEDR